MIDVDLKNPEFVRPWSPHPTWKRALIHRCQELSGIKTFLETGTYMGGMISVNYHKFDYLASVELSDYFFKMASDTFRGEEKVHLYHGSSKALIGSMIDAAPEGPILFWLDAHACGRNTGDDGEQLSHEIAAIAAKRPNSLVLIDDIVPHESGYAGPWGLLDLTDWDYIFLHGVLILHKGNYGRLAERLIATLC